MGRAAEGECFGLDLRLYGKKGEGGMGKGRRGLMRKYVRFAFSSDEAT